MYPDKIHVQMLGKGNQFFRGVDIDPHLRDLTEEDIAGVDVNADISTLEILDQPRRDHLRHGAVLVAGESAVHIQIAKGHTAGHGADAQRVHGRIEIYRAAEMLRVLLQNLGQTPEDVLSLQLIAVGSGYNTDALSAAAKAVFTNGQVLSNGKGNLKNLLNHGQMPFLLRHLSFRAAALSW